MVIRRELARSDEMLLIEIEFVGVSGQVCSLSYEIDGPNKLYFAQRAEAEAAFWAASECAA